MPTTQDALFRTLADPTRRALFERLCREGETTVGALTARAGISQPAVSKHLRILRNAGLVEVRASGQQRLYRLQPEGLRELDEWLAPYRAMWSAHLDDLERHLDSVPD